MRRVMEGEAAALTQLARATFDDTYRPLCRPADVEAYLTTHLTESLVTESLRDPSSQALVAIDGNEWVGYAIVCRGALPLHLPPVSVTQPTELVRFYVRHSHHGKGVAGALMHAVRDTCAREGCDGLWLSAWQENARALAFYRKSGFRIVGTGSFQMGEDLQDDFIMLLSDSSDTSHRDRS